MIAVKSKLGSVKLNTLRQAIDKDSLKKVKLAFSEGVEIDSDDRDLLIDLKQVLLIHIDKALHKAK